VLSPPIRLAALLARGSANLMAELAQLALAIGKSREGLDDA